MTILGTGTSQGVPVIGCDCEVCQSKDARNKRLRVSILVQKDGKNIVVDAGPDFRQQMLRSGVRHLDAVVLTHEHNDHIIGIDDVRPFNFRQKSDIPVYATKRVQADLKNRFKYVFAENKYPGAPSLTLHTIANNKPFEVAGIPIIPIEVMHGKLPVLGFRFGDFTYITDARTIEPAEIAKIKGTKVLVINALHYYQHYSHFNVPEALEAIKQINPQQAYITHVSHYMGLAEDVNKNLPPHVQLAYDEQVIQM
ncbi:MAG: MBL fold metallo-hydrolase [Bacteroidota bacterium]